MIADTTTEEFIRASGPPRRAGPGPEDPTGRFAARLGATGAEVRQEPGGGLLVSGVDSAEIGGLATASEAHGGRIELVGVPGAGATFRMVLPAARSSGRRRCVGRHYAAVSDSDARHRI